jgi:hypothetical protein
LLAFVGSQLFIMAIGLVPLKYWRGIRARTIRQLSIDEAVPAHAVPR